MKPTIQQQASAARPFPVATIVGDDMRTRDGSAADSGPVCLGLPEAMVVYQPPTLPEPDGSADLTPALGRLTSLSILLSGYRVGALPQVMNLQDLDAANLRLIEETLGAGEVSAVIAGPRPTQIQESRLTGVWRVRETHTEGRLLRDVLEIADLPGRLRFGVFDDAADAVTIPDIAPFGVMNAFGVLAELNARVAARVHGDTELHIINLTLLPQTGEDLAFLHTTLGSGGIRILSRGYGNCRITATALRDVWWVQYFNSDDRLILNTLEVTDCPVAALAAQEDIEDSAVRLVEILEALEAVTEDRT